MKIITNTVESGGLNDGILDSEILNTANITMEDMEERLQGLKGDVANTSHLTKLENDKTMKIPNGLTNGFKESSDKSSLHKNGSSDFNKISEDDFHLELEASDEEINEEPLNTSSKCEVTKKKEIIPKASDVLEKNLTLSVPIEKEDLLGIDEAEIVSENKNASESMAVGENDIVVIKVGSLLDCEETKKICSKEGQKTEETITEDCFYAPAPNNSENTDEVIEVNVVFSEVVIGNDDIDSSSEKQKERNVVKKSDESELILCNEVNKTEVNETSLDDSEKSVKGNNLDNDLVVEKIVKTNLEDSLSEKCLSDSKLNKNMEADLDINHSRDSLQSLSESSLDFQLKSFPLREGAIKCNLDNNNDLNIIEEGIIEKNVESKDIKNSEEKSSLDKIVLNSNDDEPNELNNLRNDSDLDGNVTIVDIGVVDKSVDLDLKENTNLPLDSVCKENTIKDSKPTLTKSLSADEISLNDVIESVVENFEEQKDSFDDDDFGNIIIASPREAKEINLELSFEEKKTLESTQESVDTMNNSEEWMVLDELDESFSSLDDQTDNVNEKTDSSSEALSCEIEDEEDLEVEESAIDIEETDLIDLYPSDVINDCDTESFNEEVSNKDEEKSKHTDIDSIISNNKEVTIVDVEKTSKEIESIILSNEEETNVDNEKVIFKQIDPIVLSNEELVSKDVEKSLPKKIDLIALNNEEVSNMDIEESVTTNDKINNMIVEESVTKDDITHLNDEEVSNKDDYITDLNNEDVSNIDVEEPINKDDKLTDLIDIDTEQSIAEEVEPIGVNRDEFEEKDERRVDEEQVIGEIRANVSKGDTNMDDISVDCKVVLKDYLREETSTNLEIDESFSISGKTESIEFETSNKDDLLDNKTHTIVKDEKSIVMCEEIEDAIHSEDKISALLIEELTTKIESEEILLKSDTVNQEDSEIVSSEDKISDRLGLEITKQFKIEESEQSNKETQLVLPQTSDFKESDTNPTDSIISLCKTTKEAEEDLPATLRKRSASYLDELEEIEAKRLKPVDETSLLVIEDDVSVPVVENNVDSTVSKLKRNNSNTEFELNIVKRPKLCKDGDEDLATCSDVVEECIKFAETKNDESENLKELSVSNNLGSVKSVPEARNSSDSDISYIRNILKSSMDTVDNNRSGFNKSNNKFRRKEEASDLELTLDKPKKMTVSNNSKQDDKQTYPKNITNLDLAIERVVEGASESPLNKMTLLKKFHKDQLKNLTRYDLEELIIVKLCESITDRSVIGQLRLRCHKIEQMHDQWRKKAVQLEKSHRELEMVLKRYLLEASNTKKERQPIPIKVTRSVGLQVVLASSIHGNAIRQKSSSSTTQQSSHHRKQPSVSNKPVNSSTSKSTLPIVPGTSKPSKASLSQVIPQQTQSGLRILTPKKTNQVDLESPVKTTVPPRNRSSFSTPASPVTAAPSPKVNSLEVIDLTDKEEKNKQLQQKQQTQQQKLKQQLMQQQQQQKQKQQLLQQKQQQQKQLAQKNHPAQQNQQVKQLPQQVKQPPPLQKVQKQLQGQQPKQQHTVGIRAPTTVSQNGIRLLQAHQLTSTTSPQGMAILVPTSTGQNGTTRTSQLFITAAPTTNQLRPVVQQNRPSPAASPLNISGNSAVLLRPNQLIPIQQTTTGVLRSPPAALPIIGPRGGIQQIRPPLQPIYKHPAPLPLNPQHPMKPGVKLPPPKPQLKIAKTVNGIMLSWSMAIGKDVADIASYQLYAYQESSQAPSTALWKKVGDVKALPLPMACTLTQFVEGHKYHFSVRAVDIHSRIGAFSVPGSILLTSGK